MAPPKKPRAPRKARALPAATEPLAPLDQAPASAGDNNPPEPTPTPFERLTKTVESAYEEAKNWLDGDPISTEGQAEQVTKLKNMLADLEKEIGGERDAVTKPLHKAWKDAIAEWKPLEERVNKARLTAANALTPWLQAIQAENTRKAKEAADEAEAAAQKLRDIAAAQRKSEVLSEEQDIDRARAEQEVKDAQKNANHARRQTATVTSEAGKAHLRTYWLVKVETPKELMKHYLATDPDWFQELIRERAEKEVRAGTRSLPGCKVWSEQRAV